ncbi:unnamed protein product [Aphis gossypii]|uniref:Uncharacterized protein n=1 Tax=Aphis gossypii TaxID=80765 RepID=A0A9P0J815_APHGO|nr:unnamed protein product [Aphis gossypii]
MTTCTRAYRRYLIKARDACHWIAHVNDPPSPYNEFDDWLAANQSCGSGKGAGAGNALSAADVLLYMVFKGKQAATAVAMIMLSAMVIAYRSAQFVFGRASRPLRSACKARDTAKLCCQALFLFALNVVILFAVYWPAYNAFVLITKASAWVVIFSKTVLINAFVGF